MVTNNELKTKVNKIIDEAYKKGWDDAVNSHDLYTGEEADEINNKAYKDGLEAGKKYRKINDRDYKDGLEDGKMEAWNCARKIREMDYPTRVSVFGCRGLNAIFSKFSVAEAITKVEEYEQLQEEQKAKSKCTIDDCGECPRRWYCDIEPEESDCHESDTEESEQTGSTDREAALKMTLDEIIAKANEEKPCEYCIDYWNHGEDTDRPDPCSDCINKSNWELDEKEVKRDWECMHLTSFKDVKHDPQLESELIANFVKGETERGSCSILNDDCPYEMTECDNCALMAAAVKARERLNIIKAGEKAKEELRQAKMCEAQNRG